MSMIRRLSTARRFAFATAFAIAFTQVALAGFACPLGGTPQAMQQAMDEGDCSMTPDAGSKTLCVKTCQDEPQKNEVPNLAALPPAPDAGLRVEHPERFLALAVLPPSPDRFRATGPPPHQQYSRYLK